MLKFLIITFLASYLFYKIGGLLFRALSGTLGANRSDKSFSNGQQRKKPRDGNVNIDYVPNDKKKSKKSYDGGEYIDYEELD